MVARQPCLNRNPDKPDPFSTPPNMKLETLSQESGGAGVREGVEEGDAATGEQEPH